MRRDLLISDGLPEANGYEFVDLGLPSGILWSTRNVGASAPEDYGDYFTWGGSINKSNSDQYTKNGNLPIDRDTARNIMGGEWRMPTRAECQELINNCDRSLTERNGIQGWLFTSKKNDQSIFFPLAGYYNEGVSNSEKNGYYWSTSNLSTNGNAYRLYFNLSGASVDNGYIANGYSVRGVLLINNE